MSFPPCTTSDTRRKSLEKPMTKKHENVAEGESFLDIAAHTLKQTMPEALGGGYPVQAGIIKDENGNVVNEQKPVLEQIKEKLGIDEINPASDQIKLVKESQPYVDEAHKARVAAEQAKVAAGKAHQETYVDHSKSRAPSMPRKSSLESLHEPSGQFATKDEIDDIFEKAKHTYKQTMPEALGGGYPIKAGVIRDISASEASAERPGTKITAEKTKQKIKDDAQPRDHPQKHELPTHHAEHPGVPAKVAPGQAKIVARETKYHVEEAKNEIQTAIEKAIPHLQQAVAQAKPHVDQAIAHIKIAGEQGEPYLKEAAAQIKAAIGEYIEQIMAQMNAAAAAGGTEKGASSTLEQAKSQIKEVVEQVKPHLEQAATKELNKNTSKEIPEKAPASEKSALEQAKVAYRETMPEILGGRPSSIPEVIRGQIDRQAKAQKQYEEFKEFQQTPPEEQSLADKIKHGYREAMPSLLGGRPETMGEKLQNKVDNLKEEAQGEVDNLKSSIQQGNVGEVVKEKAQEFQKEHLPESLGGRPPTLGEKVETAVIKAVVKNRGKALINGTLEQIENNKILGNNKS